MPWMNALKAASLKDRSLHRVRAPLALRRQTSGRNVAFAVQLAICTFSHRAAERWNASGRVLAHSETTVRSHSAKVCSEVVVESQTGRIAASGWFDRITVENSPSPT